MATEKEFCPHYLLLGQGALPAEEETRSSDDAGEVNPEQPFQSRSVGIILRRCTKKA
jgi:hypothetical protein